MPTLNSFGTRTEIRVLDKPVQIYSLPALEQAGFPGVSRLPYSMKILLENLLRREDDAFVKADDIRAVARWDATAGVRERDLVHAGARAAAGLHRRAVRRRPGGDARRRDRARRKSGSRQSLCSRSSS